MEASRGTRVLLCALALTTLLPAGGRAQGEPIATGSRVRVRVGGPGGEAPSAGPDWLVGYVLGASADTLWMGRTEYGGELPPVAWSRVDRFEVSRGVRSDAWKGALYGAGVGTVIGAITAMAMPECEDSFADILSFCASTTGTRVLVGAIGTALGTGFGALIGSRSDSERWHGLSVPEVRARLGAREVGLVVSFDARF